MFDVLETREVDELGKLVSRRSNELILCIFIGAPRLALHVVAIILCRFNFTGSTRYGYHFITSATLPINLIFGRLNRLKMGNFKDILRVL